MSLVSMSSILTAPSTLASLKRAEIKEDFPAPVLPTIPTFSFALMCKLRFFKTNAPSSMYFRPMFSNSIVPFSGQAFDGSLGMSGCFSLGKPSYSSTRSTDINWLATSADCLMPHWTKPVRAVAWVIAKPTSPPFRPNSERQINYY